MMGDERLAELEFRTQLIHSLEEVAKALRDILEELKVRGYRR